MPSHLSSIKMAITSGWRELLGATTNLLTPFA